MLPWAVSTLALLNEVLIITDFLLPSDHDQSWKQTDSEWIIYVVKLPVLVPGPQQRKETPLRNQFSFAGAFEIVREKLLQIVAILFINRLKWFHSRSGHV